MSTTNHLKAWIDARLAEYHEAEVARDPLKQLAAKFDKHFPHPNPKPLSEVYPLRAIHLSMEYAARFQGAKVVIADGFVEVETRDLGDGLHRVAA